MRNSLHTFLANKRWSWIQDLEADLHKLRYLFWECTRRCNLNCLHCGSDCGKDDDEAGLPRPIIEGVLDRIAQAYDASGIVLVTTGGEPLVRKDVMQVLAHAGELGFRLGMVTNGMALDQRRAEQLAEVGLESIVVSLDGPEPIHEWLRDRKGSFRKACRALSACRQVGLPIVEGITCVTPRSIETLEQTYEITRDLGATHWRVFNIFPAGRARDNRDLLLDDDQIRRFVQTMVRLRQRGKEDGVVVNLSEEGFLGWDWEDKVRDTPYFCRAGVNISGIMADGAIAACPNLAPWMHQGNVREDDFVQVWEQRYELFRDRSWTQEGDCAGCKEWPVCKGNSLHLWDSENKRPHTCHYKVLNPASG